MEDTKTIHITATLKDQWTLDSKSLPPREVNIEINEDGILIESPGVTPTGTMPVDVLQGELRLSAWDKIQEDAVIIKTWEIAETGGVAVSG